MGSGFLTLAPSALAGQVRLLHSFLVPHGSLFLSGSAKARARSAGWEEQPCINKPFPYV